MNKNLKFIYFFFAAQAIISSIVEKKLSEISDNHEQDNNTAGSFFSRLQRKLLIESLDEPVPIANIGMDNIGHSELTFPHDIEVLKTNLKQFRDNAKALIPPNVKNAAINVYIANAELLSKHNVDLNAAHVERKTQDIPTDKNFLASNIKLTEAVNSKPERMLKQIRKTSDDSPARALKSKIDNTPDLLKQAENESLFDLDIDAMYSITKEDLDLFNRKAGINGNR